MKEKTTLKERREEAKNFTQTIPYEEKAQEGDILLLKQRRQWYGIITLSKKKEFHNIINFNPKEFWDSKKGKEAKSYFIDTDKIEIHHENYHTYSLVKKLNDLDITPIFFLVKSDIAYNQASLDKRILKIVNQPGFDHQILESKTQGKIFTDQRFHGHVEKIILEMSKQVTKGIIIKDAVKSKLYRGRLNLYNPNEKKHVLEVIAYRPIEYEKGFWNPQEFPDCYSCHKKSGEVNHEDCKKKGIYTHNKIKIIKPRYQVEAYIELQRGENILNTTFKRNKSLEVMLKQGKLNKNVAENILGKHLEKELYYGIIE